jgi:TolA-binding protein
MLTFAGRRLPGVCESVRTPIAIAVFVLAARGLLAQEARQAEMRDILGTIAQTDSYDKLVAAYARGNTLDRDNRTLHDSFIRRLLQIGRVNAAWHAATALSRLDANAALAWGVLAYIDAGQNRLPAALGEALKAAQLDPGNLAYNHNAAQLAVWYENLADPSAVPAWMRPIIADLKAGRLGGKAFQPAYQRAQAAYGAAAEEGRKTKERLEASKANLADLDREIRSLAKEVADLEYLYIGLDTQVLGLNRLMRQIDADIVRSKPGSPERQALSQQRNVAQGQLQAARVEAARVWNQGRLVDRERREHMAIMDRVRADAAALEAHLAACNAAMRSALTWQVPPVEGAPAPPPAAITSPDMAPPATRPGGEPGQVDLAAEADSKLKLAKLYVANGMHDHARRVLKEIARFYPRTGAATTADKMLKEMGAASQPAPK